MTIKWLSCQGSPFIGFPHANKKVPTKKYFCDVTLQAAVETKMCWANDFSENGSTDKGLQ